MTAELAPRTLGQSRTVNQTVARIGEPARKRPSLGGRTQLLAAFRKIGTGVDAKTAQARTENWYRSRGADWTRGLS
jgi:hypothetical protein